MRRLILLLTVAVSFLAARGTAQVVVSPEGWATTPGPAVGVYGVYAPLLVTPVAHLDTPPPGIGATSAAPGQQVGATSSAATRVLTPTPPNIVPRVINAPPMVLSAIPEPERGTPAPATEPQAAQTSAAPEGERPRGHVDLGVAPIGGVGAAIDSRSLAQAAAGQRRAAQPAVPRTITNQDIQRMNEQTRSGRQGLPQPTPAPR